MLHGSRRPSPNPEPAARSPQSGRAGQTSSRADSSESSAASAGDTCFSAAPRVYQAEGPREGNPRHPCVRGQAGIRPAHPGPTTTRPDPLRGTPSGPLPRKRSLSRCPSAHVPLNKLSQEESYSWRGQGGPESSPGPRSAFCLLGASTWGVRGWSRGSRVCGRLHDCRPVSLSSPAELLLFPSPPQRTRLVPARPGPSSPDHTGPGSDGGSRWASGRKALSPHWVLPSLGLPGHLAPPGSRAPGPSCGTPPCSPVHNLRALGVGCARVLGCTPPCAKKGGR